jgi:hypothetical protein
MNHGKRRNWTSTGVVACITAAAVFGTAVPANATSALTSTSTSGSSTTVRTIQTDVHIATGAVTPSVPGATGATTPGHGSDSARSWSTIIRTAINALKKIPTLWKKLSDGVKKSYATFQRTAWPAIKTVVKAVSALITAWDIWKFFN